MSTNFESFNKFEIVKIISTRAEQISNGAKPCIDIKNISCPIKIAEEEFRQKKSPVIIYRQMTNGKNIDIKVVK
jgi:DNA-directed RNA polymerase I, II, and III subunit RPABC2